MRKVPWRYGRISQGWSHKKVSIWQPRYISRWQEEAKRFGRRCWGMPIDGSYIHTRNNLSRLLPGMRLAVPARQDRNGHKAWMLAGTSICVTQRIGAIRKACQVRV